VLDAERVEVIAPGLDVAGHETDRVIAGGSGGGIGCPPQLDRDVDTWQLKDHGVAGASAIVVIELAQVFGVEHSPIPGQAGVQVAYREFDVM
jgi:hypothetical protein